MNKKTLILIIVLALVTGILMFLAITNDKRRTGESPIGISPTAEPSMAPYANLSFSADTLDLTTSNSTTESVDVIIDTKGKPVFGAQIELKYDPEVITDVVITNPAGSFFGANADVKINSVDEQLGRVSYGIALSQQADEKSGTGVVIRLNFKVNKDSGAESSTITFLPKSQVTSLQTPSTILNQTKPLNLILSK